MNCVYNVVMLLLSMFASYLVLYLAGTAPCTGVCTMNTVHILVQVGARDARHHAATPCGDTR